MIDTRPKWAEIHEFSDVDALHEYMKAWGPHSRKTLRRGQFRNSWTAIGMHSGAIGWFEGSLAQKVSACSQFPLLHVSYGEPLTYRVGMRTFEAAPGTAVFVGAGTEYELFSGSGRALALQANAGQLCSLLSPCNPELNAVTGLCLELKIGGALRSGIGELCKSLSALPHAPTESARAHFAGLLNQVVAAAIYGKVAGHSQAASQTRLKLVEDWMTAHLTEPISMAQICTVAQVEARSLQKGFAKRHGMSPMRWLHLRRLAQARTLLLDAEGNSTVTRVLADVGLSHAGRFAVEYAARYGESPSVTLRSGRLQVR